LLHQSSTAQQEEKHKSRTAGAPAGRANRQQAGNPAKPQEGEQAASQPSFFGWLLAAAAQPGRWFCFCFSAMPVRCLLYYGGRMDSQAGRFFRPPGHPPLCSRINAISTTRHQKQPKCAGLYKRFFGRSSMNPMNPDDFNANA
jgi:hypothetical protein